eukprot:ctg_68.g71
MASESAAKARSPSPPVFIPGRSRSPGQSGGGTSKSSLPSYDARMPNDLGIITSASDPDRPLAMSPRGPLHLHTNNAAGTTRSESAQRRHALGEQAGGGSGATTTESAHMKREASDTPMVQMASPSPRPADAAAPSRTPSHLPLAPHPPVDTFAGPSTTAWVAPMSSTAAALSRPVDIPAKTSRTATADLTTRTSASGIMHGRSTASPSVSPTPEPPTPFSELPALMDAPRGRIRTELFKTKVQLCCQVYDFTDGTRDAAEKEGKRTTLIELVDYVSTTKGALPEEVYRPLVDMFRANLFRTLHPASGTSLEAALARVRAAAALCGFAGGGSACGPQVHRSALRAGRLGSVRFGGPAGARLPQDRAAPHLRQVHAAAPLHTPRHRQRVPLLRVRVGAAQRRRRAFGDPRLHYQRVCVAAEGGAQELYAAGAAAAAHPALHRAVPPAAGVLHDAVCGKAPAAGGGCDPRSAQVLAADQLTQRGALLGRAGGGDRADASARV